jgi:histidinol-phosphate aminotransferase
MANINRRAWLKTAGLVGSAAFVGLPQLSAYEKRRFNPRPLEAPVRLTSNENPYGPSDQVRKAIRDSFDISCRYPYWYMEPLVEMLADKEGVKQENIVVTVGSTEALRITGLTYGKDGGEIVAAQPTFLAMMSYAEQWKSRIRWVPLDKNHVHDLSAMEQQVNDNTKLVFVCNPNNPTSTLLPEDDMSSFCERVSDRAIVFSDEAYYDYIQKPDYPSMVKWVRQGKNVIVSRTFSKVYGLAGLRIGYIIAPEDIAAELRQNMAAYPSVPAIQAAKAALKDKEFYDFSLQKNSEALKMITDTLDEIGLKYNPSNTNFVFFESGREIETLQQQMKDQGVLIGRPFPPFTKWCRISTGTLEEVNAFAEGIKRVYG